MDCVEGIRVMKDVQIHVWSSGEVLGESSADFSPDPERPWTSDERVGQSVTVSWYPVCSHSEITGVGGMCPEMVLRTFWGAQKRSL